MMKRVLMALMLGLATAALYYLNSLNVAVVHLGGTHTLWEFLGLCCAVAAIYQVVAIIIQHYVQSLKGPEGEVRMLTGFARVMAGLAVLIAFLYALGVLKTAGVLAAGFTGMLLGWSLQAPVSGLAAWALVTLKRPFRVSDRVQFPSLGLTGDVKRVGMMYTILDQVGGTIGSEDPIGRDILIPNAMLFSQVAINYTVASVSPFFIDEVVIRLTYDSDWDTAEQILLNAARNVTAHIIKETGQEPYVRSDIWDYGIFMRLRYMTMAKDRPRITHEIVKHVFKEIQENPRVDMAIPFVYSYRKSSGATGRRLFPDTEGDIQEIPIDQIEEPAGNGRHEPIAEQEIEALMQSIRERGMLQPVLVAPRPAGGYVVLAGDLRLQACRKLGWKAIPAIVKM